MKYYNLFVYGTLLHASTQRYIIGREVHGKTAFISGWQKQKIHPESTIFMARENVKAQIKGKILSITSEEIAYCDSFESEGFLYQRRELITQSGITVFIYTELDRNRVWSNTAYAN